MFTLHRGLKKLISQRGKDNPILTMSDEIGADAHLYRQTVCSHNIGDGQTLLSARPTVTFPALPLFGRYQIIQLRNRHACKQLAQSCYMKVERFRIMTSGIDFLKFQFGFGSVLKKPGFGLDWVRFGSVWKMRFRSDIIAIYFLRILIYSITAMLNELCIPHFDTAGNKP